MKLSNQEKLYKEFLEREDHILRAPYNPELEFYSMVQAGNVAKVRELCEQPLIDKIGLGTLSTNKLQNIKYHFVITTALVARYCIEGGLELTTAYGISDFYIQKADKCKTPEAVSDLHPVMCLDYTNRMRNLQKKTVISKHIARCLDYIYDNLGKRITVPELASFVGLDPSYLSRLFKSELKMNISEYILNKKIDTAQNMLAYSDYSISQISSTLAFNSQSHFTEVFKKRTGLTPSKYRSLYFRSMKTSEL